MHIDAIDKDDAKRIARRMVCEELPIDEWCEEGSVLFALRKAEDEIKCLKVYTGVIEMLLERVKVLEKEVEKL